MNLHTPVNIESKQSSLRLSVAVCLAICILAIFSSQFFMLVRVSSISMEPTLRSGDVLVVQRARLPLQDSNWSDVGRGAIIVFRSPEDSFKLLVKRVVALGGDRVRLEDAQLVLNGVEVQEPYLNPKRLRTNFVSWPITSSRPHQDFITPIQYLVVLGDNRDSSEDSRYFGAVPVTSKVGQVILILNDPFRHSFLLN